MLTVTFAFCIMRWILNNHTAHFTAITRIGFILALAKINKNNGCCHNTNCPLLHFIFQPVSIFFTLFIRDLELESESSYTRVL